MFDALLFATNGLLLVEGSINTPLYTLQLEPWLDIYLKGVANLRIWPILTDMDEILR